MPRFEATVDIDRPVAEVFAFLADGENDRKFSPRVQDIARTAGRSDRGGHRVPKHGEGRRYDHPA